MISEETVSHVAKLARLALTPEETRQYAQELSKIMDLVDQLSELDLSRETVDLQADQPTLFREDDARVYPDRDALMHNAPLEENDFFRVPKILDEGEA